MSGTNNRAALEDFVLSLMGCNTDDLDDRRIFKEDVSFIESMEKLSALLRQAEREALLPIDAINRKIDADTGYGELDAQEDIEKYVDDRLVALQVGQEQS